MTRSPRPTRRRSLEVALLAIACAAALLLPARSASATQHLVSPGESWDRLAERARPGDEIILMPGAGHHRPGVLDGLRGTAERPIIIRGHPGRPASIEAENWGLLIRRSEHLELRDLVIRGARISGISLTSNDGRQLGDPVSDDPSPCRDITIHRVVVERTKGEGERDAITAESVRHLRIDHCRFHGWGGAAVRLVDCHDVVVTHSRFAGVPDAAQTAGVSIELGSSEVTVRHCHFEAAVQVGVAAGITSSRSAARAPEATTPDGAATSTTNDDVDPDEPAGPVALARAVVVEQNVFAGNRVPWIVGSVSTCTLRFNTLVRPTMHLMRVGVPSQAGQATGTAPSGVLVANNLFTWTAAVPAEAVALVRGTPVEGIAFDENLFWFGRRDVDEPALPGTLNFPQLLDVDPGLDDRYRPTASAASGFGVQHPE